MSEPSHPAANNADVAPHEDMSSPAASWAQELEKAANDKRRQPWKKYLAEMKTEGEDLIDLKLPNQVQCGGFSGVVPTT